VGLRVLDLPVVRRGSVDAQGLVLEVDVHRLQREAFAGPEPGLYQRSEQCDVAAIRGRSRLDDVHVRGEDRQTVGAGDEVTTRRGRLLAVELAPRDFPESSALSGTRSISSSTVVS
jgi:hypothetical protein